MQKLLIWPSHVPVAVRRRGDVVENVHYGSVVAVDADGSIILSAGEPAATFYGRSALKPLQALAMVRSGLTLDAELLAVASSSHSGEPHHLALVARILDLFDLDEGDLRNVVSFPYDLVERADWVRDGRVEGRLAQNCSGKHAAMLATCIVNGWPTANYFDTGHPLQETIRATIEGVTGEPVRLVTVDGCGAPLFGTTLTGIARGYSHLTGAPDGTDEARIVQAMRAHPDVVAGRHRDVTAAMRALPGLLFKDGADGIQLVGLPDGRALAVKIADGNPDARMPVTIRALTHLGVDCAGLGTLASVPTLGGETVVGELSALDFLPEVGAVHL